MTKKKYKQGDPITSFAELDAQEFIIFNHKVYHRGFWQSWQYRHLQNLLKRGQLFRAVPTTGIVVEKRLENGTYERFRDDNGNIPVFQDVIEARICLYLENGITDADFKAGNFRLIKLEV